MSSHDPFSVMLVDDNDIDIFINQKVIALNEFSDKVISLTSGRDTLNHFIKSNIEEIPDLLFLDLNMPVVDGFKFLSEFAKFPEDVRNKCHIVVLTSSDNLRDRDNISSNPDVMCFLSKPLSKEKLDYLSGELRKSNAIPAS